MTIIKFDLDHVSTEGKKCLLEHDHERQGKRVLDENRLQMNHRV